MHVLLDEQLRVTLLDKAAGTMSALFGSAAGGPAFRTASYFVLPRTQVLMF